MIANRLSAVFLIMALAPGCDEVATPAPHGSDAPASALFLADYRASAIYRYDSDGAFHGVVAAGAEQRVDRPVGVRLGPSGALYVAGFGRGDIVRYDARSGAMRDVFYWDTRLLEEPVAIAFYGDELIALGNDTQNAVVIDPAGRAVRDFGFPTMRGASDLVLVGDALLVATESHPQLGSAIQVWDVATGTLRRHFATYEELAFASGIALGADGLVYATDYERGRVMRFDPHTGTCLGAFATDLDAPVKLEVGPDGALYVLDAIGLHRLDPVTGEELALVVAVGDGQLQRPLGFAFVTDAVMRELP